MVHGDIMQYMMKETSIFIYINRSFHVRNEAKIVFSIVVIWLEMEFGKDKIDRWKIGF